jgi:tRNA dimethylallyltransferase
MEVSLKDMDSVIVIVGPTASGKTKISIELAKDINGEIISADSMQVYRLMDIGTAKPDVEEMSGIKHYLIDEVLPDEEFSVARFKELALKYIKEIKSKGKIPIIAGGTGLYINSLIYNIDFSETDIDWDLRGQLKKEAENKGNKFLHDKLREIDPEAADRIHINDTKRTIRAIEVFKTTRKPISYHQELSKLNPPEYNFILVGLRMDRQKLYERINKRVDMMLEAGLVKEVKKIKKLGYDKYSVAMQGLGYKEILAYLRGELTYEECVDLVKRDTRRYAKRQITWFKKTAGIYWIDIDKYENQEEILKNIKYHIATHGIF